MGPREVKGHVVHIIAQFIQCKLLFAIRCDTMTESCCLFPFSPQLLTPDVVCMFEMKSYEQLRTGDVPREGAVAILDKATAYNHPDPPQL